MTAVAVPAQCHKFFAEVFSQLDAVPVKCRVKVVAEGLEIGFAGGNPVFRVGDETVVANFRGRWLPEHPVPVVLGKSAVFTFVPTTGNRVKVRIR